MEIAKVRRRTIKHQQAHQTPDPKRKPKPIHSTSAAKIISDTTYANEGNTTKQRHSFNDWIRAKGVFDANKGKLSVEQVRDERKAFDGLD